MQRERERYPAFQIPTICLPATIDNNIPGSELSVGADSALNLIVDAIDRLREAGTATRRCFVVQTMGGFCGYLALLGGLSGGAVRVYLHEEGITLQELADDVERMVESFRVGQRLFLTVMNEKASPMYTSDFLCRLFEQESQGCSTPARWSSARPSRAARRPRSTGSSAPGWPRTPSTGSATRSTAPAPAAR